MASNTDEKGGEDVENGNSSTESAAYQSDSEKAEPGIIKEGAIGEPDSDHDEVEQMDEGHLNDLERQHVGSFHRVYLEEVLM